MDLVDTGISIGVFQSILIFIMLLSFVLFLMAIISIIRNEFKSNNKIVWILVVLFMPLVGSILYFIIGRKMRIRYN